MGFTFQKEARTKVEVHIPAVDTVPELTSEEALVNEYIDLYQVYDELGMKKHIARMEEIKKELQQTANAGWDANVAAVLTAPAGELEYGPRSEMLEVKDPEGLLNYLCEKLGDEAALSTVKFSTTDLRKLLTEAEIYKFANKVPGSRTLKSVRPK